MTRQPRTEADQLLDRVIVDQHGHYWRDYGAFLSMPPVSDENNQTEVAAVYVRAVRVESRDGSGPARYIAIEDAAATPVPAPTLDVEALGEAIFRVGTGFRQRDTASIPGRIANSQDGAKASGEFAELVAAEYARLSETGTVTE